MEYVMSVWKGVHDNAVKTLGPGDWNWVSEQLANNNETDDKYSEFLFNLVRFDATKKKTGMLVEDKVTGAWLDQRKGANIAEVTGLVIDYDNESLLQQLWTIDEVTQRFRQYTFLIYSSHSYWKNHPAVERFRLVLPFAKPVMINSLENDWHPYVSAMKKFIGYEEPQDLPEEMWYQNEETGITVKRDKPSIDKQSFNPVQGFFLPSCPLGKNVVYQDNQGEFVDPSKFERAEAQVYAPKKVDVLEDATRGGAGVVIRETFDVLAWLKANGLYVRPIAAGKHQIICPWHHEHTKAHKSGAVLLPARDGSLPNVYCQHNHNVSTWKLIKEQGDEAIRPYCVTRPEVDLAADFLKTLRRHRERSIGSTKLAKQKLLADLLPGFNEIPVHPYSREKRTELIRNKCLKSNHRIMHLYAFEGFGKSYYAYLEVTERKNKVLFASLSNEQASEQAESFRKLGLRVQLIPGREYLLRLRYNVEIQSQAAAHPWDIERLAESPTKRWMKENLNLADGEIEKIWLATEAPQPDWVNHDIICTTIARTMAYGKIQKNRLIEQYAATSTGLRYVGREGLRDEDRIVPENAVIFFDDPDKEFFTWYKPYNPKFLERAKEQAKKKFEREGPIVYQVDGVPTESEFSDPQTVMVDSETIKVETINGREYFVRPEHLTLGYALVDNRLVFTTTEELTRNLILNMYPKVYQPKLMPDEKMIAGDITMIKTNIVSSKRDGFLPPVVERLHKEGFEFHYIADGQGAKINLVNNKGQNMFADSDTVIEISEPHYDSVTRFIDELHEDGWTESDRNAMKVILALDALQQAIGRNSGYRWSDQTVHERRECIVLCEPKLQEALIMAMRYHIGTVINSVDERIGAKKDYKSLVNGVCWFIRNLDSYLRNGLGQRGQAFWDDVQSVIRELAPRRKVAFRKRVVAALKAKIKATRDVELAKKLSEYVDILGG
jgi:hypothetical protein